MGIKEENTPVRIVRGYAGAVRPTQIEAGTCRHCSNPVFVEAGPVEVTSALIVYFHHGCEIPLTYLYRDKQ